MEEDYRTQDESSINRIDGLLPFLYLQSKQVLQIIDCQCEIKSGEKFINSD